MPRKQCTGENITSDDKKQPSAGGLGATLSFIDPDTGLEHMCEYASRSLLKHERSYNATLVEMAAISFALQHWHTLLYGRKLKIRIMSAFKFIYSAFFRS